MAKRAAIYRLYDSSGALLYVGISKDPRSRWAGHAATKAWWPEVAHREIGTWFASVKEARTAEDAAIRSENPRYNIRGFGKTPVRNFRVATDLWEAAKARAHSDGLTISDVIMDYLRQYISTPPRSPRA
jgi:hypothetical protein